jgi:hypothetical protein
MRGEAAIVVVVLARALFVHFIITTYIRFHDQHADDMPSNQSICVDVFFIAATHHCRMPHWQQLAAGSISVSVAGIGE